MAGLCGSATTEAHRVIAACAAARHPCDGSRVKSRAFPIRSSADRSHYTGMVLDWNGDRSWAAAWTSCRWQLAGAADCRFPRSTGPHQTVDFSSRARRKLAGVGNRAKNIAGVHLLARGRPVRAADRRASGPAARPGICPSSRSSGVLWEREPLLASHHFQDLITPPHDTDIVVVILWSRLGTPLPADGFAGPLSGGEVSGTEWEFEDALKSHRERNDGSQITTQDCTSRVVRGGSWASGPRDLRAAPRPLLAGRPELRYRLPACQDCRPLNLCLFPS
jgi:hypothetical protein